MLVIHALCVCVGGGGGVGWVDSKSYQDHAHSAMNKIFT